MAKKAVKANLNDFYKKSKKKKRPGIVSKTKHSYNKLSKFYSKRYRGQGR